MWSKGGIVRFYPQNITRAWFHHITYLLSVIVTILHKSGDIEIKPGPAQIEKLKKKLKKFWYMKCRSLDNKYENYQIF